jgi:hypothetical protein
MSFLMDLFPLKGRIAIMQYCNKPNDFCITVFRQSFQKIACHNFIAVENSTVSANFLHTLVRHFTDGSLADLTQRNVRHGLQVLEQNDWTEIKRI